MNLRRAMADHGFESNDDYEYAIRTLMAAELGHVRCLHVEGESGRRKTAFANALDQQFRVDRCIPVSRGGHRERPATIRTKPRHLMIYAFTSARTTQ